MSTKPRTYVTRGGEVREVPVVLPKSRNRDPLSGGASDTRRLKMRNDADLAKGVHPATRVALLDPVGEHTCKDCAHHQAHDWFGSRKKIYHKCDIHRLGMSHGAASDIRLMWPACTAFVAKPADG